MSDAPLPPAILDLVLTTARVLRAHLRDNPASALDLIRDLDLDDALRPFEATEAPPADGADADPYLQTR